METISRNGGRPGVFDESRGVDGFGRPETGQLGQVSALVGPHLGLHVPHGVGDFLPGTLLGAAAALLFAVGSVLQHDAATAASGPRGPRLREMVRRPTWVAGQAATIAGSGVQVAALALAPVSIVQPLLAATLIVALVLRSVRTRRPPSGTELLGAGLTGGGLAVFLIAARPAAGTADRLPPLPAVVLAVVIGVAAVVLSARTRAGTAGALSCGAAAGLAAGIAAVLISSALRVLAQHGLVATLAAPELWGAIVMAVTAQLGAQQAFARGALTWSLPALTVCDPVAAVPVARYLLHEHLAPGHAAVWLPAGAVAVVGVALLARSDGDGGRPAGTRPRPEPATTPVS